MFRFFIIFLTINLYSGEAPPEVKKIDEQINNQQIRQKSVQPDELLSKIKESKKTVKPKVRVINGAHPKLEVKNKSSKIHRDFTIYNFKRIDDEISVLQDEVIYTAEELGEIRSREKIYIEALESLLLRSKKYDHFFTKWDDLKESFKSLWAVGGGSLLTATLGALGFWVQRKRKKKKENSGG